MRIIQIHPEGRENAELTAYIQDNDSELEMIRWKTRPAMLVLPGGGYAFHSEREGEPIALKYSAMGYQTFVLHYTLFAKGDEALQDASAAIRAIRSFSKDWHVDPHKIAVSGFSAGGNLAIWTAAKHSGAEDDPAHPNALVLGYPAVTGKGCRGFAYDIMSDENAFRDITCFPATFIWTTQQDELVDCTESPALWSLLQKNKVPAELHIFEHGPHGFATADAATGRPDEKAAHWLPMSFDWLDRHFGLK